MPKFSAQPLHATAPVDTDQLLINVDLGGAVYETHREDYGYFRKGFVHRLAGFVSNPQAVYTQRAQIVLFRALYALTITRIHIHGPDSTPGAELAGDLKWATDVFTGGFADAAVIDVCDTTSGVVTITAGFDDATVASGKYIYFQMDASPNADWKDFYIEVYYTED